MSDLVRGEASESDEETFNKAGVYAKAISGEASESDEEVYEKSPNDKRNYNGRILLRNNLLQRKLVESNIAIWKSLVTTIRGFVLTESKQLLSADQILIKSQVSMQSVLSSLNNIHSNSKHLHEKTEDVFTANFIPSININI